MGNKSNDSVYNGLVKAIVERAPDRPFTVPELHEEILHGKVEIEPGHAVPISDRTVRDRLAYLCNIAVLAARPRAKPMAIDSVDIYKRFVTEGAFYRTGDGGRTKMFVWDTNARWYWDPRVSAARLYGNVLPHLPFTNTVDIARTGQVFDQRRPADRYRYPVRFDPVSTLPDGVELPELDPHEGRPISINEAGRIPSPPVMVGAAHPPEPQEQPAVLHPPGCRCDDCRDDEKDPEDAHYERVAEGLIRKQHEALRPSDEPQIVSLDQVEGGTVVIKHGTTTIVAKVITVVD